MRDAQVVQETELTAERTTLGRHPSNDIVLAHRAVSGQHAVITTIFNDAFLEDLGSTNGTFVNGQRIGKHVLVDGDQITLASVQLQFIAGAPTPGLVSPGIPGAESRLMQFNGRIDVLNGSNAGKQMALNKPLTTLGRPGVLVVVISRSADGYQISHIEGEAVPMLNGAPIGKQAMPMANGDVIDLAGTRMAFCLA